MSNRPHATAEHPIKSLGDTDLENWILGHVPSNLEKFRDAGQILDDPQTGFSDAALRYREAALRKRYRSIYPEVEWGKRPSPKNFYTRTSWRKEYGWHDLPALRVRDSSGRLLRYAEPTKLRFAEALGAIREDLNEHPLNRRVKADRLAAARQMVLITWLMVDPDASAHRPILTEFQAWRWGNRKEVPLDEADSPSLDGHSIESMASRHYGRECALGLLSTRRAAWISLVRLAKAEIDAEEEEQASNTTHAGDAPTADSKTVIKTEEGAVPPADQPQKEILEAVHRVGDQITEDIRAKSVANEREGDRTPATMYAGVACAALKTRRDNTEPDAPSAGIANPVPNPDQDHGAGGKTIIRQLPKVKQYDRQAYQLSLLDGMTQQDIAEKLTSEHRKPFTQGQVSRMITRVKKHADTSGLSEHIPKLAVPAVPVDPQRMELGARTDHRPPRQRDRGKNHN